MEKSTHKTLGIILTTLGAVLIIATGFIYFRYLTNGIFLGIPCTNLNEVKQLLVVVTFFFCLGLILVINSIRLLNLEAGQKFIFPKYQLTFFLLLAMLFVFLFYLFGNMPPDYGDCKGSIAIPSVLY
ncbi:MAG: hypothetical protein KBC06_00870 [Candidatus Pacebacteria bacterium]|nr:hypothetical protein [Candidatus Paceibacterota bacterium]